MPSLNYDPINVRLPPPEELNLYIYLNEEWLSMAFEGYATKTNAVEWREKALMVIFKYSKCENFDPVVPYLAMNYFDRYMSRLNPVPALMKRRLHDLELVAIGCLTLAWKMRDKRFKMTELKARQRHLRVIPQHQLWNMELCIFQELDWNVCSITPFSFLQFFVDIPTSEYSYFTVCKKFNEIIIQSQSEMSMTKFRPSVIGGAAFLLASSFDANAMKFPKFVDMISGIHKNYKSQVMACFNILTNLCKKLEILDLANENPKQQQSSTGENESHQTTETKGREMEMTEMPTMILGTEASNGHNQLAFELKWGIEEAKERNYVIFCPNSELPEPKGLSIDPLSDVTCCKQI